jgi:Ca2+-binding EF-hand superfamily protein
VAVFDVVENIFNMSASAAPGISIDEAELKAAFEFFDVSGTGKITLADLKNRLGAFYKNVPLREYKFLMNNQSELTLDDLRALLENNEIKNFDPVAEAFKVYDPQETGYVDTIVLRGIFEKLGFGTITEEDVKILVETADVDKDGKISLEDFRRMIDTNHADPLSKK